MRKFRVVASNQDGVYVVADSYETVMAVLAKGLSYKLKTSGTSWASYSISAVLSYEFANRRTLLFNSSVVIEDMGPVDVFLSHSKSEVNHEERSNLSSSGDDL